MKTFRSASRALFLLAAVAAFGPASPAQDAKRPPAGSGERPPAVEAADLLGGADFASARVGLNRDEVKSYDHVTGEYVTDELAQRFVFSKGFALAESGDCALTLRNDDVKLLRWADSSLFTIGDNSRHTFAEVGRDGVRYVAELYVPLRRLDAKKGRSPYRHTHDRKQAERLGLWRATYRLRRGGPLQSEFADAHVAVYPAGRAERRQTVAGQMLTFTFDTKEDAVKFDEAFRRAIKLCGRD